MHTIKAQVVMDKKTKQIICTNVGKGREHDFKVFKQSRFKFDLDSTMKLLGDRGYQGMQKIYQHSQTPIRKPPKKQLTAEQKLSNQQLASQRIPVEHVFRSLKIFRIFATRYRNRRKRFGLRLNLIASISNSLL